MDENKKIDRLLQVRTLREKNAMKSLLQSREEERSRTEDTRRREGELESFDVMRRQEEDALFDRLNSTSRNARSIELERGGMRAIHGYRQVFTKAIEESREKEAKAKKQTEACRNEFTAKSRNRGKAERLLSGVLTKMRLDEERNEETEVDDEFVMLYRSTRNRR
jgi:flagellar biosynthesis chaperone FliJ